MLANTSRSSRRAYPWRRRLLKTIAALLLAMLAVAVVLAYFQHGRRQRIRAELDRIRAQGMPASKEDLAAWYPEPPPGENSAELYQQAFEERKQDSTDLRKAIEEEREEQNGKAALSEGLREMVRAHLEENAETLRLLHEAAKRPGARHPVDMSKGYATELPHLARLRDAARLLKMQATFAAAEGDTELAVDALLAILATAESLRDEPILISQLVRVACHGIAEDGLKNMLAGAPFRMSNSANCAMAWRRRRIRIGWPGHWAASVSLA